MNFFNENFHLLSHQIIVIFYTQLNCVNSRFLFAFNSQFIHIFLSVPWVTVSDQHRISAQNGLLWAVCDQYQVSVDL
jgi:hypothetical protein